MAFKRVKVKDLLATPMSLAEQVRTAWASRESDTPDFMYVAINRKLMARAADTAFAEIAAMKKSQELPVGWATRKWEEKKYPQTSIGAFKDNKLKKRFKNFEDAETWIGFAHKYPHLV